ncbi:MAG: branched-chain amino acid ABC transporter substrate-binding protein [Terracidiphilus sp.]
MIGGARWTWWIGFHLAVALLLFVDSRLPAHRSEARTAQRAAWLWTACLAVAAALFAGWIALRQGHVPAFQFVAGYAIETSLSIDNLFVFLILFQGFEIRAQRQHQALTWGVAGAIVLRAAFIAVGVTLIRHFAWVTYLLGVFLLYAAWRLFRERSAGEVIPAWIRRLQPAQSSLLPVILAIEVTDLIFAFDSIPAVLAISHDPFIVYTSNIAAVLGLRSLYFGLAGLLDRLRYVHYGLGVLLAFVALKMLASEWIEVPIVISLAIIGGILAVCAVVSAIAGPPRAGSSIPH